MKVTRNNRTSQQELLVDETIFSVANGFIGTRGSFSEGYGTVYEYNQTYINGFYNNYGYTYEENLTGFPQKGEKYVNVYDGTKIEFYIDGKALNLTNAKLTNLEREYDLNKGYTYRKAVYLMNGFTFTLHEKKWVNHDPKDVISIDIKLESFYKGPVTIVTYLQESKKRNRVFDPRLSDDQSSHLEVLERDIDIPMIHSRTKESDLHLCSSMTHNLDFDYEITLEGIIGTHLVDFDQSINVTKHIIHTTDLYDEDYITLNKQHNIKFSLNSPVELYLKTEENLSTLFWNNSRIELLDNPYYESLLNYNIYQLDRQGGEHVKHNIAAKGISGEGYEGHYFWDTEIYMVPFFILTNPEKAKKLLLYRYEKLEEAREEARLLGYTNGVKIPWRTISGKETSPYYPAGSAQFHINSDVAYTIIKYIQATNDLDFLYEYGFELLVETARFLVEATNYYDGYYHLNSVTGPDEYTTVVDDNCYTNQLLKYHLEKTVNFFNKYKDDLTIASKKIGLSEDEIIEFEKIGNKLYIPYSEELKVFKQDRNFFAKRKLDLNTIPKEKFPLLLNYHPLFLYKHQVLKQADTLLSLVLLDYDNEEVLQNTFEYYEPITTHDSSLSKCIYSIVAYQLGNDDMATKYFKGVIETDYENTHNNTEHGLHVANLGGSYLGFVYGINGIRIHDDYLSINPRRNSLTSSYKFKIKYQNETIELKINNDKLYIISSGKITLQIYGNVIEVNDTYECNLQ